MVFKRKNKDSVTMTIELNNRENEILMEMERQYFFASKEIAIKEAINDYNKRHRLIKWNLIYEFANFVVSL